MFNRTALLLEIAVAHQGVAMANQALMLANNLRHKVAVPVARSSQMSLMAPAAQSFRTQVTGQLEGTVDAQERNRTPWTSILFFQHVEIYLTIRL